MKHAITTLLFLFVLRPAFAGGYSIGDVATDFSLKNIDGKMVSLKDYKEAKGFIVVFTCNHCPFAKAYQDRIIALDKKYASLGYPVIAINPNDPAREPEDSYENMILRAKDKGYTFPYLFDASQEIAATYGAARTPHVFVLQKDGDRNLVRYIGAIDNNSDDPEKADKKFVEDAVNALLAGKTVPLAQTKAIGCTIKWKTN